MDAICRISAIVEKVNVANPADCLEEIKQSLLELPEGGFDIAVLPKLALCSPSCGRLFHSPALQRQCASALEALAAFTAELDSYIAVGTLVEDWGKPVSAIALLHRGELVALIPTEGGPAPLSNEDLSEELVTQDAVFACGNIRFCVISCTFDKLTGRCLEAAATGCDLILIPAYEPVWAGRIEEVRAMVKSVSKATGCAIVLVNGGVGDTSSPWAYRGFSVLCESGTELAFALAENRSFSVTVDLDGDIIKALKRSTAYVEPCHGIRPLEGRPGLLRKLRRNPFLPEENPGDYLTELFELQARSLASRMENTGITKLVLAVSGGLDSTAALLVCVRAMAILDLPRENILGVTLPGFGTSDTTYYNALSLLEKLGVTRRDISIKAAVQQHFEDIGHSGAKDVTYENSQARERSQIILDLANMVGGLMVGTGDLSEEALGFCTFAGDHIANYNVNVCVTKTILRELVGYVAAQGLIEGVSDVLQDVLDTPISPELLPPEETGEIKQKTEEILGPYILHDFFLYHFLKYRFGPAKIYFYACMAFAGELEPDFIKEKLRFFFKRFCAGQFKRSCAPDSASLTEVNLCGVNYYIPSDLDPSFLLKELEEA